MKKYFAPALLAAVAACSNQKPAETPVATTSEQSVATVTSSPNDTRYRTTTPRTDGTSGAARANTAATPDPTWNDRPRTDAAVSDTRTNEVRTDARDVNDPAAPTPIDQGENESDRNVTQAIRKAVVGDDSLSFTAKNVKIITQDGKVTLRGAVSSARERSAIEASAKRVSGVRSVDNQIEVKP